MTLTTIEDAYNREPGLRDDPAQRAVVSELAALQASIYRSHGPMRRLRASLPFLATPPPVRGLYLWGGVGRGKTFLMDLFHETLAIPAKRRRHFHRMMSEVHEQLKSLPDERDPLDSVAAQLAATTEVLCFDEFFVSDIGDAMILGRLLDGLFRRGVTLVATSNVPPSGLYEDGLQRQRFLPAIRLLEQHTRVLELGGDVDYRLQLLEQAGTYLSPANDEAAARLGDFFARLAPGRIEEERTLDINGRPVETLRAARGVAWFSFAALCEGPRSNADYIEIARWYHTVIVSDVPPLGVDGDDPARRFIALVDEFYDRRVKLVLSAALPADALYRGRRLDFEFRRTRSRLSEMGSRAYLQSAHRA
ncbi:MAG: cell division protein ZapE [Woeseiaceae bacterium]|nr:cell division protein ZapE [Woeseiaceae bacterium]